jgi:hypothetical protein
VDEFLELFPEHRESNEHDLMIARINHEHAEREKLEQARQELLKRKQALIAENKKRKDDLANLDQDLEKFVDVRACLLTCLPVDHHEFSLIGSCDFRQPNQFKRSLKRSTKESTVLGHATRSEGFVAFWATTLGWRYIGQNRYPTGFNEKLCIYSSSNIPENPRLSRLRYLYLLPS